MSDDAELQAYRNHLVAADQKAQDDYDKTVLSLSGGALGVSFAFVTDVVKDPSNIAAKPFLVGAWAAWILSLTCVLISLFTSRLALRKAMRQVDDNTIRSQKPGAWYSSATSVLNFLSGFLFIVGVGLIIVFAALNL